MVCFVIHADEHGNCGVLKGVLSLQCMVLLRIDSSVGLGVLWSLMHVALYAGDCGVRVVGKM